MLSEFFVEKLEFIALFWITRRKKLIKAEEIDKNRRN
jgi:hypothetical protein